ncbi:MAG: thymidylate kinase, partial [Clostridia bacterium]|nr:thymidylate kinase [Clostridia bacterium]
MIALEGIDGSGKSVQFARLKARFEALGKRVGVLDFPCYESFFGSQIGVFLSGSGSVSAADVDVRSMSLWYAMDRVKAFEQFDAKAYDVILLNRSTMANAAYQGSRVQLEAKKRGEDPQRALKAYIKWLFELEFDVLGVPKPDIFFIFDVPVSVSHANVAKKGRRDYVGGEKADVYEKDMLLLTTVRHGYLTCSEMFDGVHIINCVNDSGKMRSREAISEQIIQ